MPPPPPSLDDVLIRSLLTQIRDGAARRYGLHVFHAGLALVLCVAALADWWEPVSAGAMGWFLGLHAAEARRARRELRSTPERRAA